MAMQTAVLCLVEYPAKSLLWGLSRLVLGKYALQGTPGLEFFRVLGSGRDGGFNVRPSFHQQGLFCVFDTDAHAKDFLENSPQIKSYQKYSKNFFSVLLQTYSSRGSWAGFTLPVTSSEPLNGPIAAITRASIRPQKAFSFWHKAPPAEISLEQSSGCTLCAGLGEAPYFRQATFTIWESTAAMNDYARRGAHLEAIKAAQRYHYFSESMFCRFVPIQAKGIWRGKSYG